MHKLHKAVVVMFDPKATEQIRRWWEEQGFWEGYCRYRNVPESRRMERKYPQLQEVHTEEFIEPMATLRTYITDPFIARAKKEGQKVFTQISLRGPHFPLHCGVGPSVDQCGTTLSGGFAYVIMDHDRKEVLSWFVRADRMRIAAWQIWIPSQKEQDPHDLRRLLALGFFPESDYDMWRAHLGHSRVSCNVSAGVGVLTNPPVVWARGGGVEISQYHPFARKGNFVLSAS